MNTYDFDNTIDASVTDVWEALQDPASIISEWNAKIEKVSNTEWREIESEELYNIFKASFSNHVLQITSVNSKYDTEGNDITISVHAIDDHTTSVKIHYEIRTTAIFNKISLKLFGDKLAHHADNVIIKNIKKKI